MLLCAKLMDSFRFWKDKQVTLTDFIFLPSISSISSANLFTSSSPFTSSIFTTPSISLYFLRKKNKKTVFAVMLQAALCKSYLVQTSTASDSPHWWCLNLAEENSCKGVVKIHILITGFPTVIKSSSELWEYFFIYYCWTLTHFLQVLRQQEAVSERFHC